MKIISKKMDLLSYSFKYPLSTLLMLIVLFISIITTDQLLSRDNGNLSKETEFKIHSLNNNYVAWCSSNPEIISYFKDADGESVVVEHGYFFSFKSAAYKLKAYIEFQVKLLKRIGEIWN